MTLKVNQDVQQYHIALGGLFALIIIQFATSTHHSVVLPLQYDEWFSWRFFSGRPFSVILGEYPAPNNHIFYNVIAHIFLLAGFPPEIGVRLPAVCAGILSVYFFYRLCKQYFPVPLSLLLVSLLMSNNQFAIFSANARGYGFVFLFAILLLYAVARLSSGYTDRWARFMLVISVFFGLWTVPSFIYAMIVPCIALFVLLIRKRNWRGFVLYLGDGVIAGLLVVAGYSGILFFGDPHALLHPEAWTEKFMFDQNWLRNTISYWERLSSEILPGPGLIFLLCVTMLIMIYEFFMGKSYERFMSIVCGSMVLLPPVIVLLHRVYPFNRSLSFIVVPAILIGGFLLHAITTNFKPVRFRTAIPIIALFLSVGIGIAGILTVPVRYRSAHGWEYELEELRSGIFKGKMEKLTAVAKTSKGSEFYAAEMLLFMAAAEGGDQSYQLNTLGLPQGEQMLVIHHDMLPALRQHLSGYQLVLDFSNVQIFASDSFLGNSGRN